MDVLAGENERCLCEPSLHEPHSGPFYSFALLPYIQSW